MRSARSRSDGSVSGRGIFLREPQDAAGPVTCTVEVRPVVHAVSKCPFSRPHILQQRRYACP